MVVWRPQNYELVDVHERDNSHTIGRFWHAEPHASDRSGIYLSGHQVILSLDTHTWRVVGIGQRRVVPTSSHHRVSGGYRLDSSTKITTTTDTGRRLDCSRTGRCGGTWIGRCLKSWISGSWFASCNWFLLSRYVLRCRPVSLYTACTMMRKEFIGWGWGSLWKALNYSPVSFLDRYIRFVWSFFRVGLFGLRFERWWNNPARRNDIGILRLANTSRRLCHIVILRFFSKRYYTPFGSYTLFGLRKLYSYFRAVKLPAKTSSSNLWF